MFDMNTLVCLASYTWLTDSSASCTGDVSCVCLGVLFGVLQAPFHWREHFNPSALSDTTVPARSCCLVIP